MPTVITLPCLPSMVPAARVIVRNLLAGIPRADDAEQIAGELIANSVRYSLPPGGTFELTLDLRPGRLRIEVTEVAPADPPPTPPLPPPPQFSAPGQVTSPPDTFHVLDEGTAADYARGLTIVRALADRRGLDRYPDHAVWWAELTWTEPSDKDG